MNAREQLAAAAEWLGYQDECLSFGLRNSMDALRLYDYAQAHPEMPEMADEWTPEQFQEALGYYPLSTPEAAEGREVGESGAAAAHSALMQARVLLDSVAFVAIEGDTTAVLEAIDSVCAPPLMAVVEDEGDEAADQSMRYAA